MKREYGVFMVNVIWYKVSFADYPIDKKILDSIISSKILYNINIIHFFFKIESSEESFFLKLLYIQNIILYLPWKIKIILIFVHD